ncbi:MULTISPECIES: BMC domain-containing protein [Clostridium]|uniref:Carboxysome shell and ethanolamine utilization microcompartment protein CcmL/EutN n=1 Tax=Clostridium cadaveris TaxID=1529 RepID=A0A1I2K416_9CLOT|nr:BMC domain-containing protein [Clostridium cadaveris]MDU4950892.1 BMC domain-containing protein [Clostridium sp.]MDM8310867.1 BMC domain-containing protein [Clostridium cadaveris]MDY4949160.1 BMC domain-containing protein [Clostridium cadaveris]NME63359.1 BMC domain-containing protein [Clostridium cadaveris]NWK11484.1 BMC domain-containing protein [Clostridium cadaveris]
MKQSLGLVEIQGLSTAVLVADAMVKSANVRIIEIENAKGSGYMTIKVVGDVGAVNAAVNAGQQLGAMNQKLVSWRVIPRPSDFVENTFCNLETLKPSKVEHKVEIKENEVAKNEDSFIEDSTMVADKTVNTSTILEEKTDIKEREVIKEANLEESVVDIKKTKESESNKTEVEKKVVSSSGSKKTNSIKKDTSKRKNK